MTLPDKPQVSSEEAIEAAKFIAEKRNKERNSERIAEISIELAELNSGKQTHAKNTKRKNLMEERRELEGVEAWQSVS